MKIIHYTYFKPFRITKANELSNPALIELWNLWNQMHNEMVNRLSTS